jgi:predicted membrane metal-binding protein
MRWFAIGLLILLVFRPIDGESTLISLVRPFHAQCLSLSPLSPFRDWYQAIVCGKNLPASQEKNWFQQTGLIHVIVVSGSHLIFLDDVLRLLLGSSRAAVWIRNLLLGFFALISNLQPPITRALVHRGWQFYFLRKGRPKPSFHLQILSGITTLAFFPTWWTSLSFLMSWFCVLALSLPLKTKSTLWRSAFVYLIMIPALLPVQSPHPASILFNTVFGPLLGLVLFPMSAVGFIHPWLAVISDFAWKSLFWLFSVLPLPGASSGTYFAVGWLAFYLVLSQTGFYFWQVHRRRKQWIEK